MYRLFQVLVAAILILAVGPREVRSQESVTLEPEKDNTLYEHPEGNLSNGAGEHLFAGTTRENAIRRALVKFDLSSIPADVTIETVSLTLNMSRTITGAQTVRVHRLRFDWGEAGSDAAGEEGGGAAAAGSDATWIHMFYDTHTWPTPGGDFEADASATLSVADVGSYTWESEGLVADVQQWVDDDTTNFGWILVGNESANTSAKRFDSRENATPANRPSLTVTYTSSTATEEFLLPETVRLGENFPEPAFGSTTIPLELDSPRHVVIELFDLLGRRHRVLADDALPAGHHQIEVSTEGLAAGVYVYCGQNGSDCRRLVVMH